MTAEAPPECIAAYGAAWVEPDATARRTLLEQAWAADAVYCDPTAVVTGREALSDHIGGFQAAMPGGRIEVTSEPVLHHDSAFFRRIIDRRCRPYLSRQLSRIGPFPLLQRLSPTLSKLQL